jgi:long-subunit acyl-CoA synthetase (AMP-forming)
VQGLLDQSRGFFSHLTNQDPSVRKQDLSSIKFLMCGAAPLSAELLHQLSKLLPDAFIGQGYGLSGISDIMLNI